MTDTLTTIEHADDYHAKRGNAAWAQASLIEREAALYRATDYINVRFVFIDDGSTSIEAHNACAMLALSALTDELTSNDRLIKRTKEKLDGVGETEVEYAETAQHDPYAFIAAMLSPVIVTPTSVISTQLVR